MKITTKAELQALPIGAAGRDKDGCAIIKVDADQFVVTGEDDDHAYSVNQIAGVYYEGSQFMPLTITSREGGIVVDFSLSMVLPMQDLDLLDHDKLAQALEDRLKDDMLHYVPTIERTTKDWQIEAQKRNHQYNANSPAPRV